MEKPNAKERFSQNVCLLKKGNNIMQQKERERETDNYADYSKFPTK